MAKETQVETGRKIGPIEAEWIWQYLLEQTQLDKTRGEIPEVRVRFLTGKLPEKWRHVGDYFIRDIGLVVNEDGNSFIVGHAIHNSGFIKFAVMIPMWGYNPDNTDELTHALAYDLLEECRLIVDKDSVVIETEGEVDGDGNIKFNSLVFPEKEQFLQFCRGNYWRM